MDTTEHTELGDALNFLDWETLKNNPYTHIDQKGSLHIHLQGFNQFGLPGSIGLTLSAGEIIAMSGDYFGGREVSLNLPSIAEFKANPRAYDSTGTCETLGEYLIKEPVSENEEQKLISSYKRLANSNVQQSDINTIYTINNAKYIPFSSTLNFYVQQLMFALRVKNYSEILNRNLSHFTPWSVRVYTIGHHIALKYARIYYELTQLLAHSDYQSENSEFNALLKTLEQIPNGLNRDALQDMAHRYQALALGMEFFCFHYYTDHFAAGHIAFMGDLRSLLPQRFGVWGSILVNNLHDELNRITVYTKRVYDPTPDKSEPPIEAGGDGDFDVSNNYFNKQACLAGMSDSLQDLHQVFKGSELPTQSRYGGLEQMPDIDDQYRQPQPLLLLGADQKIYYRTDLNNICLLSPSQLQATYSAPLQHGYTELSSKLEAFSLVFKLRVLPFAYSSQMKPLTTEQLKLLEAEESELNPGRKPIPQPPIVLAQKPVAIPAWQKPASDHVVMQGLAKNGLLAASSKKTNVLDQDITLDTKATLSSSF
ncbi:Dot/Icm T4SS effector [Legionella steigerwaltii]|uniref:Dot/Icm T4SS effector n=1 Tax=Legionella steigerwaltii TaxID=460 RepID=A0A378L5V8_9GAMM|nr:hypothetical protein [Legionella steigerwaltii]KTD69927.1 Dot/Icm secretion system substrate [Legionella steigerwaltii]STY21760.1 Dot/Icm T4SS effector [Legionella steigerwaltii]